MPNDVAAPAATTLATPAVAPAANTVAPAAEGLFKSSAPTATTTEVKTEPTADEKAAAEAKAKTEADVKTAADAKTAEAEATRRAALTDEQRKVEDDAKAKADAEAKAKNVPEKYEFKTPEGVKNDPAVIAEFEAEAKALNLTQEQAQKLYDIGVKLQQKNGAAVLADVAKTQASWLEASKADKEFGGDQETIDKNMAVAAAALDLNPAMRPLLIESKLGDHPEIIRWMFRVGKLMQQDTWVQSQREAQIKDPAKALYGKTTPN